MAAVASMASVTASMVAAVVAAMAAVVFTVMSWIAGQEIAGSRCHEDRDHQQLQQ